jgi:hypothetical protein|tara:strand:+ start:303 stop:635 length:333 start_codon:yes stop_codon:yes gene_type:complete
MSSMQDKTKRNIFTIDVSTATPPCTKYSIPSTFELAKIVKKSSNLFGKSSRDDHNSYLAQANTKTPNSTAYNPEVSEWASERGRSDFLTHSLGAVSRHFWPSTRNNTAKG